MYLLHNQTHSLSFMASLFGRPKLTGYFHVHSPVAGQVGGWEIGIFFYNSRCIKSLKALLNTILAHYEGTSYKPYRLCLGFKTLMVRCLGNDNCHKCGHFWS